MLGVGYPVQQTCNPTGTCGCRGKRFKKGRGDVLPPLDLASIDRIVTQELA